jgi:hypothetical protein
MLDYIIENWISGIIGIIMGYILFLMKKVKDNKEKEKLEEEDKLCYVLDEIKKLTKELQSIKKTTRINTQNNIIKTSDYYKQREYITPGERRHIIDMYEDYKKSGGNGLVDNMVQKLLDIPVREE